MGSVAKKLASWAALLAATAATSFAWALGRAVPPELRTPLRHCFFVQRSFYRGPEEHLSRTCNLVWQGTWPLGLNPKVASMALRAFVMVAAAVVVWSFRRTIAERLGERITAPVAFISDRPLGARWLAAARTGCMAFFVRSPGLVLLYAAANDALLVPSFSLEPEQAPFFKLAQALLGVLVLTQSLLPLCGSLLMGTWLYLLARLSWMAAIEAAPLVAVAAVYVTSPWQSQKLPSLTAPSTVWLRRVVGICIMATGYLALYDYERTAALAQQMPTVMTDPLLRALMMGQSDGFQRETWVLALALAQIGGGFLLTMGVFARVTALVMAVVLGRLVWAGFGGQEVPRLFQVAAMLVLVTSESLDAETEEKGGLMALASSMALGAATLFPLLYWMSTIDRRAL